MKEHLVHLKELQTIDLQVSQLDAQMAASAAEVAKRRAKIAEHDTKAQALAEKIESLEKRRRELETEMENDTARIRDRQGKLMSVQTNREYQSLLKETDDAKKANKQREEEILQLMEQIEASKTKAEEEKNLRAADESLLTEETAQSEQQAGELAAAREKILKERAGKAKAVTASMLKKYDMLRERRNGIAVVEVVQGVCRGCHMNIPPQLFNELRKEQSLLSCPTCNRIIFYQAEAEQQA
ncbi:MAG TPA: C4-type zinc ribbon domain-containing protein [Desulfurivibrionaceae bacterium]|nr:C4-type zinc ribbon domain-containing protein [Desulfurivibrionaceae bacterium]